MDTARPESAPLLQLPCPQCGTFNRIAQHRLHDASRCGRCHEPLLPGIPIAVSDGAFERQVERSPLPVLLDLWAPWCGPCHAMEPVLQQVARRHRSWLKVVKVNIDENPQLARRFAVRSIPSLRILRGAHEVDRIDGAVNTEVLEQHLARVLA